MTRQEIKEKTVQAHVAYYYWNCPLCEAENEIETTDTSSRVTCDNCKAWYYVEYVN